MLVDPGNTSIFVTCYNNKDFSNEVMFEFNDGGNFFPKNFSIKTESIEIIVQILVDKGIPTMSEDSPYFKPKLQKHGQPA